MGGKKKTHRGSKRGAAVAEIGRRGKWTAAGAARAVRDARIATAAHQRRAEVAGRWEVSKLVSARAVWRSHLIGQAREMGQQPTDDQLDEVIAHLLLGGSGVAPPYPADLGEAAQAILERRADDLDAATLYVVSPSMCDVIIAAAQTLTLDDLSLLTSDDLPSPSGLVMLPFPLIVRSTTGGLADDRAYVWHTPAQLLRPEAPEPSRPTGVLARITSRVRGAPTGKPATMRALDAVRVTSYMDAYGPVRPDSFRDMARTAAAAGTPLPPLLADSTRTHAFEPTITDAVRETMASFAATAREHGDRWRNINAGLGFDESDNVTDSRGFTYRPGDEIDDADDLFSLRFLYAFWRLCAQQIAQLDDEQPNGSALRQGDRAGVSADVRVASIRPTRHSDTAGVPAGRDWQHRWVVRMHKVRQWYPSEQRHKILYRGPYIKGPADKPLLGGDVIRSVT